MYFHFQCFEFWNIKCPSNTCTSHSIVISVYLADENGSGSDAYTLLWKRGNDCTFTVVSMHGAAQKQEQHWMLRH